MEPADREAVEAVVHSFPPYSDFGFANLYAWDAQVSSLHGNLAVRLTDYLSEVSFLTFIGRNSLVETANQLLDLARTMGGSSVLRAVPACVARTLSVAGFAVTEHDAANDYVYAVEHVANMHEWAGHSARRRIRQFSARHPCYTLRHAPLHEIDAVEFRALFALWEKLKGRASPQASREHHAFERFLRMADTNIETIGLYVDERLVAFSSFELLPYGTAITHFSKADHGFHGGICDVLYWEEARLLRERHVSNYNAGPDLGLEGLRQSKKKYQPCGFLRTFMVRAP